MKILTRIYNKIKGNKSLEYYEQYRPVQWLSQEEIREDQFRRIKLLLDHSYTSVAYYRNIFDGLGLLPQDIKSFEDFKIIPILTKSIIKANNKELISKAYLPQNLSRNTSGGSTGEPLTFYQDKKLFEIMEANSLLGNTMAGWSGKDPIFYFWGNPREFLKKKSRAAGLKERLSGKIIFNSYNYNDTTIAEWVAAIRNESRVYLYGYTSVLTDIARFIKMHDIHISSVKGVMTTAEKLYSWQRELVEQSFNAQVFDQYGSREVPGMACECGHGNMHQLTHSAYLEFEDDPAVINGSKKIIATCLTNFAMPFIRYEIGDYARSKDGNCPCGRGFPMMDMDIGRTADCFVTPEGNIVYGTFFVRQMYGQDRVQSFQFHQTSPDIVNLYVVRGDGFTTEDAVRLEGIGRTIHEHASQSMQLCIHFVDSIPRTQGGKHRFVVSEVVRQS
jgi:phenylacetate-CoA ligase